MRLPPPFVRAVLAVAFSILLSGVTLAATPNVLLIISDDQGWADVPWRGSPARMPNLDALRQSGTELMRFYTSAVCSPTRAALYTGRSAMQQGIRNVVAPNGDGVSLLEHLMPESFRAAGYQTALSGKWHLGSSSTERLPHRRGFDQFYGFAGAAVDFYTHRVAGPASMRDWQRNGVPLVEAGYTTDLIAAEEVRLLRARDVSRPFFHVVAFNAPHTPYAAPDELKAHYPTLAGNAQTYAAMLESLDQGIGLILAELAALGLVNDTLVIFHSDNGGAASSPARNTPLRGAKVETYDGGVRVPAIWRWPRFIRAGATSGQFVTPQDVFPTLAAALGVTPRNALPFDGLNLWNSLRDGGTPVDRAFTIATPTNYAQFDGPMKLVRIGTRDELYDIVADPSEATNLASAQPAMLGRLRTALAAATTRSLSVEPAGDARLINLSARAAVGGTAGTPILGFVLAGGQNRLLVRGIGPSLADFGVTDALADPFLELRQGRAIVQSNDNWPATGAEVFATSGAFALSAASKDAALEVSLPPAAYTVQTLSAVAGGSGVVLMEIYDAGVGRTAARLVNASARAFVGAGASTLIAGISVGGNGASGLLIRAAGPALGKFGLAGALADPVIALYRGGSRIATNDDWSAAANATQVTAAAVATGAFAFDTGSRDAALLTTLPAGTSYTVQVSGKNNATGTVLVEFYVVP